MTVILNGWDALTPGHTYQREATDVTGEPCQVAFRVIRKVTETEWRAFIHEQGGYLDDSYPIGPLNYEVAMD